MSAEKLRRAAALMRQRAEKAPDGGRWRWEHLTEDDKRAYRALTAPLAAALDAAGLLADP